MWKTAGWCPSRYFISSGTKKTTNPVRKSGRFPPEEVKTVDVPLDGPEPVGVIIMEELVLGGGVVERPSPTKLHITAKSTTLSFISLFLQTCRIKRNHSWHGALYLAISVFFLGNVPHCPMPREINHAVPKKER